MSKIRKLITADLFSALRIVREINLRKQLKAVVTLAQNKELSTEDIGVEGLLKLLEVLTEKKAERKIHEFLSGPFELALMR